jgi:hypothetical protein
MHSKLGPMVAPLEVVEPCRGGLVVIGDISLQWAQPLPLPGREVSGSITHGCHDGLS